MNHCAALARVLSLASLLTCPTMTMSKAADNDSLTLQRLLAAAPSTGTLVSKDQDVGELNVAIAGSLNAQSLASRFAARPSVLDFGASAINGSDSTQAFQAAELWSRKQPDAKMIWVDPGSYKLSGTVYNGTSTMWVVPPGANIDGGLLEGDTDGTMIQTGHQGLAFISRNTRQGGSSVFVSNVVDGPTTASNYEVDGLYANVSTSDPSTSAIQHDIVAGHFASQIAPGNQQGRAWGQDTTVTIPVNADGYAVGHEISIGNFSTTTGSYGQANAKLALGLLAAGPTNSTAAILIHDAGSKFVDGVLSFSSAVSSSFIRLTNGSTDLAAIYADGSAVFQKAKFFGPIQLQVLLKSALPSPCVAGQTVFVSDGRNPGEAPGGGSGTTGFCNNNNTWFATSTGTAITN